jgi:hypothetical protein
MKQKNGGNFLRLRCRKFLFPQQSIYFDERIGAKSRTAALLFPKSATASNSATGETFDGSLSFG